MSKHDLNEYAYSKQIIKDFTPLISVFDKLIVALQPYKHYTAVWNVLVAAQESQILLDSQLKAYKKIYDKKGQTDNE